MRPNLIHSWRSEVKIDGEIHWKRCVCECKWPIIDFLLVVTSHFGYSSFRRRQFTAVSFVQKASACIGRGGCLRGKKYRLITRILRYNFIPRPLDYFGCINTIKKFAKRKSIEIKSNRACIEPKVSVLLTSALKGSKPIYNALLGKEEISNPCKTWERILEKELDWKKIFLKINSIKETKLRWFQFKIVYRILVTNSILLKMNIVQSDRCNFCLLEKDSVIHYLWECTHVKQFWNDFLNLMKTKCSHCERLRLNASMILFGQGENTKTDVCFDEILLNAKFYIYKCRLNKIRPSIHHFNNDLKRTYKIDKHIHNL